MIQETKNKWMCVSNRTVNIEKGLFTSFESIAYTRSGSIKKFISVSQKNWRWWKRKGWKCLKVDIQYKENQ